MQVLWKKEIEEINKTGYLNSEISITDALIENFYREIMKPEERELLKLAFEKSPSQEELDELLKIWDIEVKGSHKSLLLSYIMKRHPGLKFTNYERPRLVGLLKYFRFQNLKIISKFSNLGKELNKNSIIPIIFKGGLMKYLRPELPRVMGDIDIIVPNKDFIKSAKIGVQLGYEYTKIYTHSIDLHEKNSEEGVVDIHRLIYMDTGKEHNIMKSLFDRSKKATVFGVECLIPAYEDLMFITLVNLARNLRDKTSQAGLLFSLFDCKFFLENKPDFDWEIVKQNAEKTGTQIQVNFAIKFIDKISENILPDLIKNNMLFEKETNKYSNVVMYNRFYLENIRTRCRKLKLKETLKNPKKWGEYLSLKPKYMLLKTLRNHPKLIETLIKDLKQESQKEINESK